MTESTETTTKLKDAVGDASEFQDTIESLVASRPDLADPEKLQLFENALHRRVAVRRSTHEAVLAKATDAATSAEQERARKFMAFATTVGGGGAAAIITSVAAPGAPAPVIVAMGLVGLLATKFGAPRLNRWADRRQQGRRHSPV